MNLIETIANLFKPKPPKLTPEEKEQKLREIAKACEETKNKKALEFEQKKTELRLAPKITLEDLGLTEYLEEQARNTAAKWNLELLMSLEWKRFEEVCNEYLIIKSYDAKLTCTGADGGVDIKIYNGQKITTFAQCKAWITKVSVKELREFYGIMASAEIEQGIFFTTSSFTQDAIEFKQRKNITLIDGSDLIARIKTLKPVEQEKLYMLATTGDYSTPTCVNCNTKMIKRTAKESGNNFWGCINFPRCKNKLNMRQA